MRIDDPWYDTLASGWGEQHDPTLSPRRSSDGPGVPEPRRQASGEGGEAGEVGEATGSADAGGDGGRGDARAAVYLTVHRSAVFQEVRRRHRRFVLPVGAAFLAWYLAYVTAATTAPGLMGRPLGDGPFTVGLLAALAQFAVAFLLTWAYSRHARLRHDRTALELRWHTQDMARTAAGGHREGGVR